MPLLSFAQYWVPIPNDTIIGVDGYRSLENFNDTLILCGDVGLFGEESNWGSVAWYENEFIPIGTNELQVYNLSGSTIYNDQLIVVGNFLFEYSLEEEFEDLAVWDGEQWYGMENYYNGPSGSFEAVINYNDMLFATGYVTYFAGNTFSGSVVMWNGEAWVDPGGVSGNPLLDFVVYNDSLIGGGHL